MTERIESPEEYVRSSDSFLHFPKSGRKTKFACVIRGDGYSIVTYTGEKFPISHETMDKVRDIASGNMTSLDEYESKLFERFNDGDFLKFLAKTSTIRYLQTKGKNVNSFDLFVLDMLNPFQSLKPLKEDSEDEDSTQQSKYREKVERLVQDIFGVKVAADETMITNLIIKLSSDKSYDMQRFMKEALKKKNNEDGDKKK